MSQDNTTKKRANDNLEPPVLTISLTDLAAQSGIDEDTLLQRFAAILNRRAQAKESNDGK
jgi:uncharacterized protein YidB (DUF937 family)